MALSKPTPVRFSQAADQRLGEVAETNGMTKAELVRLCVEKFLDEVESTGKISIQQVVYAPKSSAKPARKKTA
jgi:hypothetical protein